MPAELMLGRELCDGGDDENEAYCSSIGLTNEDEGEAEYGPTTGLDEPLPPPPPPATIARRSVASAMNSGRLTG